MSVPVHYKRHLHNILKTVVSVLTKQSTNMYFIIPPKQMSARSLWDESNVHNSPLGQDGV